MGGAVERLTRLVEVGDRYNIPFAELQSAQIEAMNERLQERKSQIKLLGPPCGRGGHHCGAQPRGCGEATAAAHRL